MKIAIIGAGNVGSALGHGGASAGHEIVFGVRDPNDTKVKEGVGSAGGGGPGGARRDTRSSLASVIRTTPRSKKSFDRLAGESGRRPCGTRWRRPRSSSW